MSVSTARIGGEAPAAARGLASRRAVFLDKDGTLVADVPYNVDPARIVLLPGVAEGLATLRDAGYRLIVVSNQPGIAMGRFAREALDGVAARLDALLAPSEVRIEAYYWCPHAAPDADERGCDCRKPLPGLLRRAADERGIDLGSSWMVGDILNDVEAGHRAGCRAVLVDRGGETEWRRGPMRTPELTVSRFDAAARAIAVMGTRRAEGAAA